LKEVSNHVVIDLGLYDRQLGILKFIKDTLHGIMFVNLGKKYNRV